MASFTGVGDNTTLAVTERGETVSIAISGTYDMTIEFQRRQGSVGSGAWETLESYDTANATVAEEYVTERENEEFRLIVTVDTSGTAVATLAEGVKQFQAFKDPAGNDVLRFYDGGGVVPVTPPVVVTAAEALTEAEHANRTVYLSNATGFAVTLPAATGTGNKYKIVVGTTISSGAQTIVAASAADSFVGSARGVDDDVEGATGYQWNAETNDDTVSMSGSATGGKAGDYFTFEDVASGIWLVEGSITQSGASEATPFSATV